MRVAARCGSMVVLTSPNIPLGHHDKRATKRVFTGYGSTPFRTKRDASKKGAYLDLSSCINGPFCIDATMCLESYGCVVQKGSDL